MRHLHRYAKSLLESSHISDTTELVEGNQNTKDESNLLPMEDEDIPLDTIDLTQLTPCQETAPPILPSISPLSSDDVIIQPSQQVEPSSVAMSPTKKDDEVVITNKLEMNNSLQLSDEILFLSQSNRKDSSETSIIMADNKCPDHSDSEEDFQFFDDGGYNADLDFFLIHHDSNDDIEVAKDIDSAQTGQEKLENLNSNHSLASGAKENPCIVACKTPSQQSVADYSTPELKVWHSYRKRYLSIQYRKEVK